MTARLRQPRRRTAFTLNEMLIVIAIIVLMLGLAVPAFNVLTGSKSVEGATNQISAVLGQARAEAIGLQEVRGVMFFIDPRTARTNIAIVHTTPTETTDVAGVAYLDLVADRDFTPLPVVGIQTIDNAASPRTDDAYLGYNATAVGPTLYGGVILFDAYGKLISTRYGFRCSKNPASATGLVTSMASLLIGGDLSKVNDGTTTATDYMIPPNPVTVANAHFSTYSQIGIAVFNAEQFSSQGFTNADEQMLATPTYSAAEQTEETWIDTNAQLLLVNRFNGTLVKGD